MKKTLGLGGIALSDITAGFLVGMSMPKEPFQFSQLIPWAPTLSFVVLMSAAGAVKLLLAVPKEPDPPPPPQPRPKPQYYPEKPESYDEFPGTLSPVTGHLHADACVSPALVRHLREYGLDVTMSKDVGLADATDPQQLGYARYERRVLLTHDRKDFRALHAEGKPHCGIVIAPQGKDWNNATLFACLKMSGKNPNL